MKNNKGFTLIEMLVVIAVVGILSAAVLTALGPARNKGRDARIMSGISQLMILAETQFTGNGYPNPLSEATAITDDIKGVNGGVDVTYNVSSSTAAASSPLASSGFYCKDTNGKTGTVTAAFGVCP